MELYAIYTSEIELVKEPSTGQEGNVNCSDSGVCRSEGITIEEKNREGNLFVVDRPPSKA